MPTPRADKYLQSPGRKGLVLIFLSFGLISWLLHSTWSPREQSNIHVHKPKQRDKFDCTPEERLAAKKVAIIGIYKSPGFSMAESRLPT